jgi:hypothetical protein
MARTRVTPSVGCVSSSSQQPSPGTSQTACFSLLRDAQHAVANSSASSRFSRSAANSTNSGVVTPFSLAHASFCRFVKQQQLCQHWSAVRQPHCRSMHGKGTERSFPESVIVGSGTPSVPARRPKTARVTRSDLATVVRTQVVRRDIGSRDGRECCSLSPPA